MKYDVIHLKDIYPVLDKNGADPTLEILVPNVVGKLKKRPSMLVCPGGGYEFTWEGEAENVAFEYLTLGFNAFVLRYSVKPHTFPQQILEVACAFDYIINNAEEFNGDPDKNAILGFSAGGHLAASYCTMRNFPEITSVIPEPKAIQAAVLCYPVISADMPTHKGSFKALTGKDELTKEELDKFSVDKHINNEITPPTFIWTTSGDTAVDPINTLRYAAGLNEAKIPFELHIFPGGKHGMTTGKYGVVTDSKDPTFEYISVWPEYSRKWLKKLFDI